MIVIEGPDGAGKSTLSQQLIRDQITNMALLSPKIEQPEKTLSESTRDYLDRYALNRRVSVDRFVFSELCYGPIIRGGVCFTHLETVGFLDTLFSSGSILIFCLPNDMIYKRDEKAEVIRAARDIFASYHQWAMVCRSISRSPSLILRYQWNLPEAYSTLLNTIRRLSR